MTTQPMQPLFGGGSKTPGKPGKSYGSWIAGLVLLIVLGIIWVKVKQAAWWFSPPDSPIMEYGDVFEKATNHWGHTLVASNAEKWLMIPFGRDKILKLALDTPRAEDYPDALAQLRGRLIDLNGHRGPERSLGEILLENPRGTGIEIRAVPGRFNEIKIIEDHIP